MHKITIMSKPGCHLCEVALQTVQKIVAWHVETIVEEIDITQDLELLEKYREDVPVILIDGVERFRHQVDPDRLAAIFAGESQRTLGFDRMNDAAANPAHPRPTEATLKFRVRYVECDPMGYLHHSHYLPFFEMGRTEMLRLSGVSYRELEERDVLFAVTKIAVTFRRPARYDDELELHTKITRQTHVRIEHSYEMFNTATRELLCTAESTLACINRKGEVQAIPAFLSIHADSRAGGLQR